MAQFLRDAWYAAAWSNEVTGDLFPRMLLNERVVLYRDDAGDVIALANVCPHRFAQLHMGKRIGGVIECGYHGLRFDRSGACVFNPHGEGTIPPGARVKSYPVEERHGVIWIWMGKASSAQPAQIPGYGFLTDPAQRTISGYKLMRANYQLLVDNLMDASHSQFVHASLIGSDTFLDTAPHAIQSERSVEIKLVSTGGSIPEIYRKEIDPSVQRIDMWIEFSWVAPALLVNRTGFVPTGQERADGLEKLGTHLITPETDSTSHYFFAHTRAYGVDDAGIDEAILRWQRVAFGEQDAPMIEGCQEVIGGIDLDELRPVVLVSDVGVMRVRRTMKQLIRREHEAGGASWEVA